MEWLDTTESGNAPGSHLSQAFTLIQEVPSTFTARTHKTAVKAKQQRDEAQEGLLLRAFSGTSASCSKDQQASRLSAARANWAHLEQQHQGALEHVNAEALRSIISHAVDAHEAQRQMPRAGGAQRIISTVYALAGGISTCDQANTFGLLQHMLHQQGCYAALLQPSAHGGKFHTGACFRRILQQFSFLEGQLSGDMLALLDWYEEEMAGLQPAAHTAATTGAGSDDMTSPLKRLGLTTPKRPRRSARNDASAQSPDEHACASGSPSSPAATSCEGGQPGLITSPMGRLGLASPGSLKQEAAALVRPPRERPLVLLLEHVEGMDPGLLHDLITLLSESHADLPITLVLGLSTSPAILDQLLPGPCLALLQPQTFPLASAPARVDALLCATLLGSRCPGLLPSAELLQLLDDHFLQHDYTTHSYQRGLQVACLHHCQSQPLSHLSAAARAGPKELQQACQNLPAEQAGAAALALKEAGLNLEEAAGEVMRSWAQWTVMLRMILAAAQGTKSPAGSSVRELLRDASDQRSAADSVLANIIPRLCRRIQQTPDRDIPAVIQAMVQAIQSTWAGHQETAGPIQQLQNLLDAGDKPTDAPGSRSRTNNAGLPKAGSSAGLSSQRSGQQQHQQRAPGLPAIAAASNSSIAFRLAALVKASAELHLRNLPHHKPGANIFLCKASRAVKEVLFAAPRHAIHRALTQPHSYLGTPAALGVSADLEDVCIAFQTFEDMKTSVSMAEWFDSFSDVFAGHAGDDANAENAAASLDKGELPAKKARGRSSKKALQEANATGAAHVDASGRVAGKKARSEAALQQPSQKANSDEMAARFSQASAELQLLGLLRPARKRRGDFAHKLLVLVTLHRHAQASEQRTRPSLRLSFLTAGPGTTQAKSCPQSTVSRPKAAAMPSQEGPGGGGIFFFWQQGVAQYLQEHFEMQSVPLIGASAGALVATLAACSVDSETALQCAYRLALENDLFERPLGLAGIWGKLIVAWLDELLPPDAADICRGRLQLIVTNVPSFRQAYISEYASKDDLIQANMASVHIPFFLDLRPCKWYRGGLRIDGSLSDFLWGNNGELLQCDGRSFVMDYADDTELSFQRLDFMQLRSYESVMQLMQQGEAYAARVDANGGFDRVFGAVRKAPPPPASRLVVP
ncbi:hypothetical protein WJX84_000662 [Apatococcus fuscideae]|uniref:Patatin n=1 Tax=Apatococcus fuscideae TaxID=2026836 RepID=A0AAW1SWD0_9CHLO